MIFASGSCSIVLEEADTIPIFFSLPTVAVSDQHNPSLERTGDAAPEARIQLNSRPSKRK